MAATPLKRMFPHGACQSLNRLGERCGCRIAYRTRKGTLRCRYHGGYHYYAVANGIPFKTGPKTKKGKQRSAMNLRKTPSWRKHLAESGKALTPAA